jgi:coenzyme F420-reducing hydrogenase alpha subunit
MTKIKSYNIIVTVNSNSKKIESAYEKIRRQVISDDLGLNEDRTNRETDSRFILKYGFDICSISL